MFPRCDNADSDLLENYPLTPNIIVNSICAVVNIDNHAINTKKYTFNLFINPLNSFKPA